MKNSVIKIQTLNLWHNPIEYQRRTSALIQRINIEKPEVLCLQEVTFPYHGPNTAEIIAAETHLNLVSIQKEVNRHRQEGTHTGNAILSSFPLTETIVNIQGEEAGYPHTQPQSTGFIPLPANSKRDINSNAIWAWLKTKNNNDLLVINSHLSWGVKNEYQRLQEVIDINNLATSLTHHNPYALTVLALSSNATPDGDSMRFLTGKLALEDTESFWIDAYENCAAEGETGETQTPRNIWSRVMAEGNGTFDTTKLPKRRIDYLFVRDWVYGQNGSPSSARLAFTEPLGSGSYPEATVSDHYGVEATFYDILRLR